MCIKLIIRLAVLLDVNSKDNWVNFRTENIKKSKWEIYSPQLPFSQMDIFTQQFFAPLFLDEDPRLVGPWMIQGLKDPNLISNLGARFRT